MDRSVHVRALTKSCGAFQAVKGIGFEMQLWVYSAFHNGVARRPQPSDGRSPEGFPPPLAQRATADAPKPSAKAGALRRIETRSLGGHSPGGRAAGCDVERREAAARRRSNRPRASRLRSDAPRVNGNPTRDIAAAERISGVVFKGSASAAWICSTGRGTRSNDDH